MHATHSEFEQWKEDYEKNNDSWFVKGTGEKGDNDKTTTYYYCNRTRNFQCKGSGQRNIKAQGTSKIDAYCTAALTVTCVADSASIGVKFCKSHYGHVTSLGHLRLPESDRKLIASKLLQGVSFEHILDTIRDSVQSKFNRLHLTTKKDIHNIQKAYNIKSVERHKDDATSVHAWVEEMEQKGEGNPVLLYKPQGKAPLQEYANLHKGDFILVLQTPLQAELLRTFGPKRIVCIDGTHGTNAYDFTLITVMVIDEF